MGVVKNAFRAADKVTKTDTAAREASKDDGVLSKAFDGTVGAVKNTIQNVLAANHASDELDDKEVGLIAKTVDYVADTVGDVANIATLGLSRRVTNVFADAEHKLDYKAMKTAVKEAKKNDEKAPSTKQRAALLADKAKGSQREVPNVSTSGGESEREMGS